MAKIKKKKSKIILAGAAALGLFIVLYLATFSGDEQPVYLTELVRRGDILQTVNATGDVAAQQLVSVGAQVSGQVEKLYVQLGQKVEKGDHVADIDSTTQVNELNINKAKLDTYKAQLASRQITQKVMQRQYEREKALFAKQATSKESLENAEDAYASAKAAVDEMRSLVKQTQIALNTSEVNLGYTKISAPLNGTVVSVHVEEGQTVNANQTTPTIVQIADLSQMSIKIQISEGDVTKVKPGMTVEYSILGEPGSIFNTTLRSVDPGLTTLTDKNYSESSTTDNAVYYYGKLLVPNPEGQLRIGMTVQSTITIAQASNVLIVPSIVVQARPDGHWVTVLEKNNRPVERKVEVGLSDNINTEILSGLNEGEAVVAAQLNAGETVGMSGNRMRMPRL